MSDEVTTKTSADELLYLADQQRHMRSMMNDDFGRIRESIVIEAALRFWADSLTVGLPIAQKTLQNSGNLW